MDNNEDIIIKKSTLKELEDRDLLLLALEHAGVDNWEGYDIAMDIYEGMLKESEEDND